MKSDKNIRWHNKPSAFEETRISESSYNVIPSIQSSNKSDSESITGRNVYQSKGTIVEDKMSMIDIQVWVSF